MAVNIKRFEDIVRTEAGQSEKAKAGPRKRRWPRKSEKEGQTGQERNIPAKGDYLKFRLFL